MHKDIRENRAALRGERERRHRFFSPAVLAAAAAACATAAMRDSSSAASLSASIIAGGVLQSLVPRSSHGDQPRGAQLAEGAVRSCGKLPTLLAFRYGRNEQLQRFFYGTVETLKKARPPSKGKVHVT